MNSSGSGRGRPSADPAHWYVGSALRDGTATNGWLMGHFLPPDAGLRSTVELEIKWFRHPAGDRRAQVVRSEVRTTCVLLIEGRFHLDLSVADVLLEHPGDYACWGPGIDHSWRAEAESTVVTIRWPSLPPAST
jgi:quercetin dioxygenase-like cupin family protein